MAEKKDANVKEKESLEKAPDAEQGRLEKAHKMVHRYVLWSMGAGLIPVPWLDLGVLAGVQLKMVHSLSKHYDVAFLEKSVKAIIATLVGTISAEYLRHSTFNRFIKSIPIIGFIGSISMPIYSGAMTYAIGKVFIHHFESGGTCLDFNPQKVKDYFKKLYQEGKIAVAGLKPEKVKS